MKERVEISKRLVLINSGSSLVTRLLSISVLIWLNQYLLHRISPEEYSLLPILISVMMFAPLVTSVLTAGLGRYIVEAYARDDDDRITQIVSTMYPILCAAGLAFLAGGWTFAWYIDKVLTIAPEQIWDARIMMALLMLSAAIRLPLTPFGVGLYVRQKFVLQNVVGVGTELFRLSILFILLFCISTKILWVIVASVSAELLDLVLVTIISRRLVPALRFRLSRIHWPIAGELASFGGWSFLVSLADTIRTAADPLILNKLALPVDVASYHIGGIVQRQMHMLLGAFQGAVGPALIAIHAANDRARLSRLYIRAGRLGLWAFLFILSPIYIFNGPLVELYAGSTYSDAAIIMVLLCAQGLTYFGNNLYGSIALAEGKIRLMSVGMCIQNMTNLGLTFYLVGTLRMGGMGAALATFVTVSVFQLFLFWPAALRMLELRFGQWARATLIPGFVPSAAALAVWFPIDHYYEATSWPVLFFCWLPGAIVYVVVLLLIALRLEDRDDLLRFPVVGNLLQRFVVLKRCPDQ